MESPVSIIAGLRDAGPVSGTLTTLAVVVALYFVSYAVYDLYLNPLHDIPGPKLWAVSRIPYWLAGLRGGRLRWNTELHKKYGPVVRIGPNALSYADGRAWKDVFGVQKGSRENPRAPEFHMPSPNGAMDIMQETDPVRHARLRRVFLPAFSEKSLRSQEGMFQRSADEMVAIARNSDVVDMTKLFNLATFDIMAEFAFGEPLGLLRRNEYTAWVAMAFEGIKTLPYAQMIWSYPALAKFFQMIEPASFAKQRLYHFDYTASRVDKRLQEGGGEMDLWNLAVNAKLPVGDMHRIAQNFMLAGTETSASLLTGLIFYLTSNPDKLAKLTEEIRGTFQKNEDMTFQSLAGLSYLNACIQEGLRVYPPVPSEVPRYIGEGGNMVLGRWIPEGTRISVIHSIIYNSPEYFKNPEAFVPERWLGDPEYKDDNRDVHVPFSLGPTMCLGMNMAWHEMRLLLAKLIFNFDMESEVGPDWRDQEVYMIWDRKPLPCRCTDARNSSKAA